jgi:hypothetical protein
VWVLQGRRRRTQANSQAISHTPDEVQVILSRDPQLPLFPYRIEYRKVTPAKEEGAPPAIETLLVTEWYSIQTNQKLDPRLFQFIPGDVEILDRTEQVTQEIAGGDENE